MWLLACCGSGRRYPVWKVRVRADPGEVPFDSQPFLFFTVAHSKPLAAMHASLQNCPHLGATCHAIGKMCVTVVERGHLLVSSQL